MRDSIKNYSNVFSLLGSILFLILGAVMYTNPKEVVIFTTYVFGSLLIIVGLFKCVKNYLDVKKDNYTSSTEMIIGIIFSVLGIVCIFLAGVVEAFIRLIIGGWILFSGINRLINSFNLDKRYIKFWISIIVSILLISSGLYTILKSNLAFKAIGIVLMIYAILEIIGYIFNRKNNKPLKSSAKKKEKKTKIVDADIVEIKKIDIQKDSNK